MLFSDKFRLEFSVIKNDAEMKNYSSMGIGGIPEALIEIRSEKDLETVIKISGQENIRVSPLGKGTNIIFTDKLKKYVFLQFDSSFGKIDYSEKTIKSGSSAMFQQIVRKSAEVGLSGLEWAMGIPGTVGGAVVNNAGAYGYSINDLVKTVSGYMNNGEKFVFGKEQIKSEYRNTIFKKNKVYYITEIEFDDMQSDDRVKILNNLEEFFKKRIDTQPVDMKSAGCIFKNPGTESYAGKLIEECGFKGFKCGGLSVSDKHANFFVNDGTAVYDDFKRLTDIVKSEVLKKFNIELETEVEIIGEQ